MAERLQETFVPGAGRVTQRPFRRGDLLPYWKAVNDPELAELTGHIPCEFDDLENWYLRAVPSAAERAEAYFAICPDGSDEFIGALFLWNSNQLDGHCELSVFISDESHRGKGLGTDAVLQAIEYGFNQLSMEKVYLHVDESNAQAIKCYHKCGFVEEGTLRRHRRTLKGWSNMRVMSILRSA